MPSSAFVMSVAAPLVAAGLRIFLPATFGASADLVWLLCLVPVFLAPRHLGWPGALYGLLWAAVPVVLVSAGTALAAGVPVDWVRAGAVVATLAACALGAGLDAQWWRARVEEARRPASAVPLRTMTDEALPDRDLLGFVLRKLLAGARRKPPLSVALFEVDDVEERRAVGGDAAVVRALDEAVDAIRAHGRAMDVVGRWDENRFLVLLPGETLRGAHLFARRILEELEERPSLPEGKVRLSTGAACFDETVEAPEELVRRAERALDAARGLGGEAVVLFRGASHTALTDPGMTILEPDGHLREIHRTV